VGPEDNERELIDRRKRSFEKTVGKMPILAIPDSRFINKSRTDIMPVDDEYRDIREYGAYHFLYQKPYEPIIQTFLYQICIDYLNLKTFDQPIFPSRPGGRPSTRRPEIQVSAHHLTRPSTVFY
jgi:hypothetical protein